MFYKNTNTQIKAHQKIQMFQFDNNRITTNDLPLWNNVTFGEDLGTKPAFEDLSFLGLQEDAFGSPAHSQQGELDYLCFGGAHTKDFNVVSPLLSRRNSFEYLEEPLMDLKPSSKFVLDQPFYGVGDDFADSRSESDGLRKAIRKQSSSKSSKKSSKRLSKKSSKGSSQRSKKASQTAKAIKTLKSKPRRRSSTKSSKVNQEEFEKVRLARLNSLSTMSHSQVDSNSDKALSLVSGFSSHQTEEEQVKTDELYKLESRGVASNIPQIYNTELFSSDSSAKSDPSFFMNSSMLQKLTKTKKTTKSQSASLSDLGAVFNKVRQIKQTNMEASSYMASLQVAISSIDQIKAQV